MPRPHNLPPTACRHALTRKPGRSRHLALGFGLFLALCTPAPAPVSANDALHLLYINAYHAGYKWSDDIEAGLREKLDGAGIDCTLHVEFMDTKRHAGPEHLALFRESLRLKYNGVALQVIITSDDSAFAFIKANRDALFPKVPVVFCGVNYTSPSTLEGVSNITGVNEAPDIEGTLDMILALHADVRHIIVINDTTPTGQRMAGELAWIRRNFSDRLAFTVLDQVPMERVIDRVGRTTPEEVVLYTLFLKDSTGATFEYDDSVRMICNTSRVPVYGLWDFFLGHGIIGGSLLSGHRQGLDAGDHVLKILRGDKADTLRILMESRATPMVDYEAATRFELPLHKLPPGTRIVSRPAPVAQTGRRWIPGVTGTLFLSSLLVTLLFLLIRKHRVKKEGMTHETRLPQEKKMPPAEPMLSVGALATGIAHELNTPISGIVQTAALLTSRLTERTPENVDAAEKAGTSLEALQAYMLLRETGPLLEAIHESGRRAGTTVNDILSCARRNESQMTPCQPAKLLDATLALLEKEFLSGGQDAFRAIRVVRHYEENLPEIRCERAKIQEVFYSILGNAAESLLRSAVPLPTLTITAHKESRMLRIAVENNGPGMDKETCGRVFKPFCPPRNSERCRGLSLFIAYFVVTIGHNGQLDVTSKPGLSTRFTIRLPLEPSPPR